MNSSSTAAWRLSFDEKQNSRVMEEKVGGFHQACLSLQSGHGGYGDSQNCYMTEEKEMVMGLVHSHKSCLDLVQNCDLPPPIKVFAAIDRTFASPKISREYREDSPTLPCAGQDEKLGLLKALHLSQTRAREAEEKAALMAKERDCLSNSLLEESLQLFAHRQWVKLLEIEVSRLRSQKQQQQKQSCSGCCQSDTEQGATKEEKEEGDVGSLTWYMAFALCLGIAGVGFALGYGYLF
ncbi:PREDICTED: uncharacterized protein LOC104608632 isoform X2 [Nelumbo nucifera]|uniref:Uncharacterized protein LOC104608632 isoform X2 n=1 Tax=Nelumbo nucifera TaxID=4432 RepID=A0A1U8AXY3_NELNU|nr:PREDICTED: uncharacterized protein LOC104608632 isoform X2 [Nelumbo nucifera]